MIAVGPGTATDDATLDEAVVAPEPAALPAGLWTALAAVPLAACGGSSGSAPPPSPPPPPPVVTPQAVTEVQASRFLGQATMGASRTTIADVVAKGYGGWLTSQFGMARATSHWDWLVANGYNVVANVNSYAGFDQTVWRQLIVEPDQLRQRVGQALLDMLVASITVIVGGWRQFQMAAYMDVLLDNAFGNYRTLMDAITTNAAMGSFLTFLGNLKYNPVTGAQPDENYARELMQLFTIGLYQINMDGSLKLDAAGKPIETYQQNDVSQLARIFTGLVLASNDNSKPDRYRLPLIMNAAQNETGSSTFLGTTVTGGGLAAIKTALDTIFAHPNVPPFVSKQLIEHLVTSNPSPAYIGRIAAVFANDGSGTRGNMQAVIRAILLDDEARNDAGLTSQSVGKLREPVMRLTGWARAYNVNSPSNAWAIGDTSSPNTRLAEAPGHSPTVFNWFRPAYTPPNTAIATANLIAPEFQLANEVSVVGYINYMQGLIGAGTGDVKADYTDILTKAADSAALVAEVNLVLAAGQLSATTQSSITAAVNSIATTGTTGPMSRVATAILLTMASPDYLVAK